METLFTLKQTPWKYENMMSNEKAEEFYREGKLPFDVAGWGNGDRWVSCGFYRKELTFVEWVDRYRLVII